MPVPSAAAVTSATAMHRGAAAMRTTHAAPTVRPHHHSTVRAAAMWTVRLAHHCAVRAAAVRAAATCDAAVRSAAVCDAAVRAAETMRPCFVHGAAAAALSM